MTVEEVLAIARRETGVEESPPNSNNVKYNTWYYGKPVNGPAYPWCMVFVQWVFTEAGDPLPFRTASCSALLNWYKRNEPDRVVKTPEPGDIVIYEFGHTGIIDRVEKDAISAIEGNTSASESGSQSNGGVVAQRLRKMSLVEAYIRPDYQEGPHMDNTPSPSYREGVEWAVENGILRGNKEGNLLLSQPVSRQQLCTMLYRLAKLYGLE